MTRNDQPLEARATFNEVASLYDAARPGYPAALYGDLIALSRLTPAAHLLEIGSGTGHATLPLAQRGFSIDCLELGEQMAVVARRKLADFPCVSITVADFDRWTSRRRYDLVFSASAYHWLDPHTRVACIAALLAPGGHIAIFRNHHVRGQASEPFNRAAQRIYASVSPSHSKAQGLPPAEEITPAETQEWLASGLFRHARARIYRWQQQLAAEEYIDMLATHSDHRRMAAADRARFFKNLIRLIDMEFAGHVTKEYVTLLQIAQKAR